MPTPSQHPDLLQNASRRRSPEVFALAGTTPTLGIVLPVLNEGAALAAHLRALQPLRLRGVHVVVVDGGSTDTTWAIAQQAAASSSCVIKSQARRRPSQGGSKRSSRGAQTNLKV
ncbi:MAG: glycosyltransferase [Burkholderiales bacterium]